MIDFSLCVMYVCTSNGRGLRARISGGDSFQEQVIELSLCLMYVDISDGRG